MPHMSRKRASFMAVLPRKHEPTVRLPIAQCAWLRERAMMRWYIASSVVFPYPCVHCWVMGLKAVASNAHRSRGGRGPRASGTLATRKEGRPSRGGPGTHQSAMSRRTPARAGAASRPRSSAQPRGPARRRPRRRRCWCAFDTVRLPPKCLLADRALLFGAPAAVPAPTRHRSGQRSVHQSEWTPLSNSPHRIDV